MSQLCNLSGVGRYGRSQFPPTLVGDIISFPATICTQYSYDWTSTTQMYVILIFLVSVLFQDLTFFQDSDMSSYVGFHCFKISSLFEDLASMKKTLSISVGLNSHACNGQDLVCYMNHFAKESPNHSTTTHIGTLSSRVRFARRIQYTQNKR